MSGSAGGHNPWLIAVAVTAAAFMEILDTTIVNVALPHIAGTMSVSYDQSTWTLTSYLVANSIVLPISAYLQRVFGRKRFFVTCIVAFTVFSFLCGIAGNMTQLIIFRVFQGLFGGGLQPTQQAIILDTFPPEQRGKAFSVTAVATVVAPVLGPTLGGIITDHASWRWVFLINVPIGILTALSVMALVSDKRAATGGKGASTDFIGIGLIALTFAALQITMDRGEDADWLGSGFIRATTAVAVLGLACSIVWLLYERNPVVNLRVFKDRNFALGCVAIAVFAAILYGSGVLVPQLAQQHLGYTATLAGLVLTPGAMCIIAVIPVVSRAMPYIQTRYILGFGFLTLAAALFYSAILTPDIDFKTLVILRCLQTGAIGFLFVPTSTLAYLTIPNNLQEDAAALFTMFRNVAGSIGISVSTAAITERSQAHQAYLVQHLSQTDPGYSQTLTQITAAIKRLGHAPGDAHQTALGYLNQTLIGQASVLSYIDIFIYCGLFALLFVPFTFLFSPAKAKGGGGAGA